MGEEHKEDTQYRPHRQRLRGESKPKASKEGRQERREMEQRLNKTGK